MVVPGCWRLAARVLVELSESCFEVHGAVQPPTKRVCEQPSTFVQACASLAPGPVLLVGAGSCCGESKVKSAMLVLSLVR